MRSISATDVPPNFITRLAIWDCGDALRQAGPIHSDAAAAPQLAELIGFQAWLAGTRRGRAPPSLRGPRPIHCGTATRFQVSADIRRLCRLTAPPSVR